MAITGGIGSGKSVVTRLFEEWGARIVDADILAREVVAPGTEGLKKVFAAFEDMELADGSLNRPKLASIIFSDPEKKKLLESILHPLIRKRWLENLEELKKTGAPLIVYVVPLFFESTSEMPEIQQVILISAPEETRIQRIMQRDQFPRELAELRIRAQLPDSAKVDKSDFVIKNDSSLESLTEKASQVFSSLAMNI